MFTTKPFQLISSCQVCLNRPLWSKYSLWASQSLLLIAASQLQSPLLQMICLCQHCLAKKTLWSDHNLIPQIETNRGVSLVSTSFCNQSKNTFYLPVSIVCPWSFDPIGQIKQIKASHWSMSFSFPTFLLLSLLNTNYCSWLRFIVLPPDWFWLVARVSKVYICKVFEIKCKLLEKLFPWNNRPKPPKWIIYKWGN